MKKLLILLGMTVILSACATATSSLAPVCEVHEDAELSRMTADELKALVSKNKEAIQGLSPLNESNRSDRDNCLSQNERIEKFVKLKSKKVPVSKYYIYH